MKRILFYACFLGIAYTASAQVGVGTPNPKASAMLDVDATDKGLLIPRITLTSTTVFAPITGEEVEGLLVYNVGTAIPQGFYYWKNQKWNQVVDQVDLEQTITNIVTGDLGEVKKIVDYLIPNNPQSDDKTQTQAVLVYDTADQKIYNVTYDNASGTYIKTDIALNELVLGSETKTLFKRAKVNVDGELNFVETEAVTAAGAKKGEIYYQYAGEDGRIDYLNLTQDIQNVFKENQTIINEIQNIINQDGGNVYFTNVELTEAGIPAQSLYQVKPSLFNS